MKADSVVPRVPIVATWADVAIEFGQNYDLKQLKDNSGILNIEPPFWFV